MELLDLIRGAAVDLRLAYGDVGVIGALVVLARYAVTAFRMPPTQAMLGWVERRLELDVGMLQWSMWSPSAKRWWGLGTGLVISVLGSVAAGMSWPTALVAGVVAALGAKGGHDAGVMPIGRPGGVREPVKPSPGRGSSIVTDVPQPHLDGGESDDAAPRD